jgi:hypothetical protein
MDAQSYAKVGADKGWLHEERDALNQQLGWFNASFSGESPRSA